MKAIKHYLFLTSFAIFLSFLLPFQTLAADDNSSGKKNANFTIEAVLPENQVNNTVTYYYLLVQPGESQTVHVKIINSGNETGTYNIDLVPAATNSNGLVTYNEVGKAVDESMTVSLSDIAKPETEEVSVEANSTKEVAIEITPPAENFSGIVLGGVYVSLKDATEAKDAKGVSINNTYGYSIGMVLTEDEEASMYGETDLKLTKLSPEINAGSKILEASIQNPYPEIMTELKVSGKIVKKGQKETIASSRLDEARIAPNSVLPFQIDWGMQNVEAGTYTFKGTVKGKEKNWTFEEDFKISEKLAKKLNDKTVFKVFVPDWWVKSFYGLIAVTTVVFLWLILRLIKRTKEGK